MFIITNKPLFETTISCFIYRQLGGKTHLDISWQLDNHVLSLHAYSLYTFENGEQNRHPLLTFCVWCTGKITKFVC